jgi:transposase
MARGGLASHKKGARRSGRSIVLIDESGFMLQPVMRRTWAPRGCTPVLKSWDRRDRRSVISALTVPPQRVRIGLHFRILDHNVRWPDVYRFIRSIMIKVRKPITVVLDRLNAHRSAMRRLVERFGDRIKVEYLPPYAPELNPVEGVWCHTKHDDLANFVPDDIAHLDERMRQSINTTKSESGLLRSFFARAGLDL